MSKLERAFISTADKTYKRVEASNGRIMHFADGKPISQNAYNAAQQHIKYEGESVKVAIPADNSAGYTRVEVNPIEASQLGKELNLMRDDIPGQPRESVLIDGDKYSTEELQELNERIANRHGPDAVMKY